MSFAANALILFPIKSLGSITFAEFTILYIDNLVINSKISPISVNP